MIDVKKIQEIANDAEKMLEENQEWITRYAGYALEISEKKETVEAMRKRFREFGPLYVYTNISRAKSSSKNYVSFDLRYRGQSVADVTVKKDIVGLKTKKNTFDFYGVKGGENINWDSKEATTFRKGFAKYPKRNDINKKNEEHRYESALLTELSKEKGEDKAIIDIQPILLCESRFQMPTPFSASKSKISYAEQSGGGIDLLCRTKHGAKKAINIFELKDQYDEKKEPPQKVLEQAVIYSVFISKLLSTLAAKNDLWWELLDLGKPHDPNLPFELNAVAAMPYNKNGDTEYFNTEKIITKEGCIWLHWFYFDLQGKEDIVKNVKTSLKNKTK